MRYYMRRGQSGLGISFSDVAAGAENVVNVVDAAHGGLDITALTVVAGRQFKAGEAALDATCNGVCSGFGRILAAVGGAVRVLKDGFGGSIHGGAATFDKLGVACADYNVARSVMKLNPTPSSQAWLARAQGQIVTVLGGTMITASVQHAKPKPEVSVATPDAYSGGAGGAGVPIQDKLPKKPAPAAKSSTGLVLGLAAAIGAGILLTK